jgi:hypothetical protein
MTDVIDHYLRGTPAAVRAMLDALAAVREAANHDWDDPVLCAVGPVPAPPPVVWGTDPDTGEPAWIGPAPDLAYALLRCSRPLPAMVGVEDAPFGEAVGILGVLAGGAVLDSEPAPEHAVYVQAVRAIARPTPEEWTAGMNEAQRAAAAALLAPPP